MPDADLCPCGYGDECPIWCGDGSICDELADDGRYHTINSDRIVQDVVN